MKRLQPKAQPAGHISTPVSTELKAKVDKEAKRVHMRKGEVVAAILEMYFEEDAV